MTAFTLSGVPLFDGRNDLTISFQMAGRFGLACKVAGTVASSGVLTGTVNRTLGASNPPGGTEHRLTATPAFLGTVKASLALLQATAAATQKRVVARADLAASFNVVLAAGAETFRWVPLPVHVRSQLTGSLIVSAKVGGAGVAGRLVTGTAGFSGNVAHAIGPLVPVNGTDNVVASAATLLPATNGANVIGVLRSPPYAYFDGTATFLYYTDQTDAFLNGSSAFSCAVLLDPEIVNVSQSGTVCGKHDPTGTQHGWEVLWDKTTGLVTVLVSSNTSGANRVSRVNTVAVRTRSIVVFTYDGTNIHIHVNQALDDGTQTTTGTPGAMSTTTAKFAMGSRVNAAVAGSNFYKGAVCGVWVWDVVLTSGECNGISAQGVIPTPPQAANLRVAWHPYAIRSNAINAFFAGWPDAISSRLLSSLATPKPPVLPVGSLVQNRLFSDAWDKDFINGSNVYGADSNLTSNYPLNSSAIDASQNATYRIFTPPTLQNHPVITTGYRDFRNDFTLFLRSRKGSTSTVDVIFFDCQGTGLRLFYDNATRDLFLFLGTTGTTQRYDYGRTHPIAGGNPAVFCIRWNSVDQTLSLFIGANKVQPKAITSTGTPTGGTGIQLCDNCDYRDTRVIAACVPDGFVYDILNELMGVNVDSISIPSSAPTWRLALQANPDPTLPFGLAPVVYTPSDVDETPAPLFIVLGAVGTLELAGQPSDGDAFSVSDGSTTRTFEFNSVGGVAGTSIAVTVGVNIAATIDNLIAAINASPLNLTAGTRVNFDFTGDGVFEGGYTHLVHDQVPSNPFSDVQNVTITIPTNVSGKLFATGMHRSFLFDEELPVTTTDQSIITIGDYFRYTDEPYPVLEPEDLLGSGATVPTLQNPLPTIISVTADVAHNVVAIANAGPTDAGAVRSWWEVEIESGNTETFIRIDEQDNSFSLNHDHIDTFAIPEGLNFRDKRIRFVIQSQLDPSQIWLSLFLRMEGDNFDNGSVEVIILPGAGAPETPPEVELQLAVGEQAFALEATRRRQLGQLQVPTRSRYKLTRVFFNDERDPRLPGRNLDGLEFGLMSTLPDFEDLGADFQVHRVRVSEIGFLDQIAVRYYGPGFEDMWWVLAYANRIIDPDSEMFDGQELVIPGRSALTSFLTRKPEVVGS